MATTQQDINGNTINHPTAAGVIIQGGKFCCGLIRLNGAAVCNARITNKRHNISSHLNKEHDPNSAHQQKNAVNLHRCSRCHRMCNSYNIYLNHIREKHRFSGRSDRVWTRWRRQPQGSLVQF
ncbi:uncharacterized protein F4822DRAFT_414654 [Hypoxylon trugodes]|uniref:uncharacterized protein n=1 Tax=Hypoxylon trugodes TaxID=326681 RepID=UPI00219C7593|nr:uncharacterized protein F4822DRAFT_414654 [Hypoxylon trugodes]KAI1385982.1 hypothetical protein F4822DRAFT_414654 [Hypoxylon trugodes]